MLEPGIKLAINDLVYTVIAGNKLEDVEVQSDANGQKYHINLLNRLSSSGLVSTLGNEPNDSSLKRVGILSLGQREYERARRRYITILPLLHVQNRSAQDVQKAAEQVHVSSRTIYAWIGRYGRNGFRGLVTPETFGGKGGHRTDKRAEGILQHLIETEYSRDTHNKSAFYQAFVAECWKCGIRDSPSKWTVYRRLKKVDKKIATEVVLGGKGTQPYDGIGREGFADGAFPLQTIQLDHTKLDVILLDESTREVIGRPWLTVGLDVYSRCVWGYYLGLQQPNADTVGLTIINGCFKKQQLVEGYHLNEWPV